jgi:hypothetical protein
MYIVDGKGWLEGLREPAIRSAQWPEEIANGAAWVCWTLACSLLGTFLSGFTLGLLGGDLRLVTLIPVVAALPLLIGMRKLTASWSGRRDFSTNCLGNVLLTVAVLDSVLRVTDAALQFLEPQLEIRAFELALLSMDVIGPLVTFTYLGSLAGRFGRAGFSRVAFAVAAILSITRAIPGFLSQMNFGLPPLHWEVTLGAAFSLLGLSVLWRFSRAFPAWTRGKCWECGYDLKGALERV